MGQPLSILLGVDPATAHWPYAPCTIILPLLIQQQDQAADVSGIFFSVESAWNIVTPSPVGTDPSTVNRCKAYLTSRLSRRRGRKTDQKIFSVYNAVRGQVLMRKQVLPMSQAPILEEVYCRHGVSSSLKFEVVLPLFSEAKPHENLQFMLVAKHRHFSNMELHFLCFFPVWSHNLSSWAACCQCWKSVQCHSKASPSVLCNTHSAVCLPLQYML